MQRRTLPSSVSPAKLRCQAPGMALQSPAILAELRNTAPTRQDLEPLAQ